MKTLIVGWDSVSWDFVQPLLERHELPNLRLLMDGGFCGSVRSTIPPVTPVAWSSIISGKTPQKHGVYDWVWRDGEQIRVAASTEIHGTPFWRRLNDAGIRVGMVNVPLTYPPTPIDGFTVCGFGAPPPPANITFPAKLSDEIQAQFGDYVPALSTEETTTLNNPLAIYEAERRIQTQQVEIVVYLARQYPVDVLVINLMLFDHTNHRAKSLELVEQSLWEMDKHLGLLLSRFKPDSVILFGDHGARRLRGQFLLGDWLCDHGYMARKKKDTQSIAELNFLLQSHFQTGLKLSGPIEKTARYMLRSILHRTPKLVQDRFWNDVRKRSPQAYSHYWFREEIDLSASAVLDVRNIGTIYLKPRSEQSHQAGNIDDLKARLMRELAEVKDPETQAPVFQGVHDAAVLYGTNPAGTPPDLILDYHGSGLALRREKGIGLVERYPYFAYNADNQKAHIWVWQGDHDHYGVLIGSGNVFVANQQIDPCNLVDLPATLLHLYGVAVPEDFDGEVLTGCFREPQPVQVQAGDTISERQVHDNDGDYDVDETDDVLDRLRALGYVN